MARMTETLASEPGESNVIDMREYLRTRKGATGDQTIAEPGRQGDATEGTSFHDAVSRRLTALEYQVEGLKTQEKATPRDLYHVVIGNSPIESLQDSPALLKIYEALAQGTAHLDRAREVFSEEIERESELDLFLNCLSQASLFHYDNSNFQDALTALIVAVRGHIDTPYQSTEIFTLKKITRLLLDNLVMPEETLNCCLDLLEESGFDLSGPLREMDWHDLT